MVIIPPFLVVNVAPGSVTKFIMYTDMNPVSLT